MTASLDPLPQVAAGLRVLLFAVRARHTEELTAARGEAQAARGEIDRLCLIIKALQRHQFDRRAERLDTDQFALAIEGVEQTLVAATAAVGTTDMTEAPAFGSRRRKTNRGALSAHLPRVEVVIDVRENTCPYWAGTLHKIGKYVAERLHVIPAQFRALVIRRPRYACRACEGAVVQAPAAARIIESGIPTEALVAQVIAAKYADHLPLYRQTQIYARQGIALDRSTLADWVGRAAQGLRPLHQRLLEHLKASIKLSADETTAPVVDPSCGRTKSGQLSAYVRDDRAKLLRSARGRLRLRARS